MNDWIVIAVIGVVVFAVWRAWRKSGGDEAAGETRKLIEELEALPDIPISTLYGEARSLLLSIPLREQIYAKLNMLIVELEKSKP